MGKRTMELSIRQANPEDYEELCEVFADIDTLHREALPDVFRAPDGPGRSEEYLASVIADENAALFVAQSDLEIVGLVQILLRETPDVPIMVPRRYAVVDTLVVKERFRRLGVGRRLMERAHQWAQAKGGTQVEVTVWEFNEGARAFYERLGYSTARRRMRRALELHSTVREKRT
jgi:ribosomal protein S18 acetylase RimI-like enzyme